MPATCCTTCTTGCGSSCTLSISASSSESSAGPPETSPPIGTEHLERSGPTVETIYGRDLGDAEYAIEVSYEGSYELDEDTLADGSTLDRHFAAMGGWIASTLVKLGDLELTYLPPEEDGED